MNRLLSLVFILGIFSAATVHAMPIAALGPPQTGLTIQVGGGCGIGLHRSPFIECAHVYVYGGYYGEYYRGYRLGYYRGYRRGYYEGYHDAYYPYVRYYGTSDVVVVDKGICGFGSYLSCSYGTCWRFCN